MSAEPLLYLKAADCVLRLIRALVGPETDLQRARARKLTVGALVFRSYRSMELRVSTTIALDGVDFLITPRSNGIGGTWTDGSGSVALTDSGFVFQKNQRILCRSYTGVEDFVQDLASTIRDMYLTQQAAEAKAKVDRDQWMNSARSYLHALQPENAEASKYVFIIDSLGACAN